MAQREWRLYMDDVALLHICEHRLVAPIYWQCQSVTKGSD